MKEEKSHLPLECTQSLKRTPELKLFVQTHFAPLQSLQVNNIILGFRLSQRQTSDRLEVVPVCSGCNVSTGSAVKVVQRSADGQDATRLMGRFQKSVHLYFDSYSAELNVDVPRGLTKAGLLQHISVMFALYCHFYFVYLLSCTLEMQ